MRRSYFDVQLSRSIVECRELLTSWIFLTLLVIRRILYSRTPIRYRIANTLFSVFVEYSRQPDILRILHLHRFYV